MHNFYIINETVEFHPAKSTLRDIHNPDNIITLSSPSGRCLLLLINRLGEDVVTQNEFMDFVWRQRGSMVTFNTYYQSISILRKGLKNIGLGDDLIVTLPRIGLTLASETRIRKLPTDKNIGINYKSDVLTEKHDQIHKENISSIDAALTGIIEEEKLNRRRSCLLHIAGSRYVVFRRAFLHLLIFSIIAFCVFFIFQNLLYYKKDFFSEYTVVATVKKCHILLPSGIYSKNDKENAIRYTESYTQNCEKKPEWFYVTTVSTIPRASVIRCDRPFYESTTCSSVYFIE